MLGAYVTWLVQEALRHRAPALVEWYLINCRARPVFLCDGGRSASS